ncbi:MAG: GGDEF domain-containing protein [Alkalispirochaeta sp.]
MTDRPSIESIDTLVSQTTLFSTLDREERSAVARWSAFQHFPGDEIVFSPDDSAGAFYIVARGEVIIQKREDESRVRDMARFVPGDAFGEMDVLRNSPRSARALAPVDTTLIVFPAPPETFFSVIYQEPVIFARILQKLVAYIAGRIRSTNDLLGKNSAWLDELRRQVYTDKLTGLFNTAFLKDALRSVPARPGGVASILCFKPDRFKEINDTYGHEVGDYAIRELARVFRESVSPVGHAVRYRGNEMVGLLPDQPLEFARNLASTLHQQVRAIELADVTEGPSVALTVSIGIAESVGDGTSGDELLQLAYRRMFTAREAAGDRTCDTGEDERP